MLSAQVFAQDANSIFSMEVQLQSVGNNFSPDGLPIVSNSTIYNVGMNVSLYDTSNIQSIEVSLGSSQGGTDILSHTFSNDVSGSLGNGLSYLRNGYQLNLGLGQLTGLQDYFTEVKGKRTNGTYSPVILFNR